MGRAGHRNRGRDSRSHRDRHTERESERESRMSVGNLCLEFLTQRHKGTKAQRHGHGHRHRHRDGHRHS